MFVEVIGEALGTFFFLSVILASGGNALIIAVGLAAAIYLVSKVSSAHLNSTVTIMSFAKGDISMTKCISYILAQVIGGLVALVWYQSSLGVVPMA
jgi:glycerol uptake facilitator-like aquaporin